MHRRIHVAEVPTRTPEAVRWDAGRFAEHQVELALAKSSSARLSASTWKARSHAAYQGYSHLSGMEMMCACACGASARCRGAPPARVKGIGACSEQPGVDVVVVELLRPEHAGDGLTHHVRGVCVELCGIPTRRTHRPRPAGRRIPRRSRRKARHRPPTPSSKGPSRSNRRRRVARLSGANVIKQCAAPCPGPLGVHRVLAAIDDVVV